MPGRLLCNRHRVHQPQLLSVENQWLVESARILIQSSGHLMEDCLLAELSYAVVVMRGCRIP